MNKIALTLFAASAACVATPAAAQSFTGSGVGPTKAAACTRAKIETANAISDRDGNITRVGECRCEYDESYPPRERWYCKNTSYYRPDPYLRGR